MLRDREWKYIRREKDVSELYHLATDPREERNLLHQPTLEALDKRREMESRMLDAILKTMDVFPDIRVDQIGLPAMNPGQIPGMDLGQ
jgi:arylsulfatase A-like enzyme